MCQVTIFAAENESILALTLIDVLSAIKLILAINNYTLNLKNKAMFK